VSCGSPAARRYVLGSGQDTQVAGGVPLEIYFADSPEMQPFDRRR
jgi:hypothetical protein